MLEFVGMLLLSEKKLRFLILLYLTESPSMLLCQSLNLKPKNGIEDGAPIM